MSHLPHKTLYDDRLAQVIRLSKIISQKLEALTATKTRQPGKQKTTVDFRVLLQERKITNNMLELAGDLKKEGN